MRYNTSIMIERGDVFKHSLPNLERMGFSNPTTIVAANIVILGARRVLKIHGASVDKLQIVWKTQDGMTPRTLADLRSGEVGKRIIRTFFADDTINEEESGREKGRNEEDEWHFDPLDGTSSYAENQRYSTVGAVRYKDGQPDSAALCHPFEKELFLAEKGKGVRLISLDDELIIPRDFQFQEVHVSPKESLNGGMVFVDALFNRNTSPRKLRFMERIIELSGNNIGFRMTGSNIDQQRQVAAGRALVTLTDAVGGFFDLAVGGFIIEEAGGKFTDIYGTPVTRQTQVAIGSNGRFHEQLCEIAQECYKGYQGFR